MTFPARAAFVFPNESVRFVEVGKCTLRRIFKDILREHVRHDLRQTIPSSRTQQRVRDVHACAATSGSRAERDVVVRGRVAAARERAGGVVVRVAVRLRARLLEHGRIVDGPRGALALVRRAELAAAAVLVRVEVRARAHARHRRARAVAHRQLLRAYLVQVGHAAGRLAVVRAAVAGREPAGGHHAHRQVVPVHQRHVVEVQAAGARERRLGQRHGRHAAGAVALDLVACGSDRPSVFTSRPQRGVYLTSDAPSPPPPPPPTPHRDTALRRAGREENSRPRCRGPARARSPGPRRLADGPCPSWRIART